MELLLFVLFLLFSVFSALMERRKRRKQLEESQRQQEARQQRRETAESEVAAPPVVVMEKKEEEESSFGWPFEGDPFEDFKPTAVPASAEQQALEAEREALEAERRALAVERRALAMERMSLETRPGHVGEQAKDRSTESRHGRRGKAKLGRWEFDAQKARDAIAYAEIIGKPVGEREDL